jgi:peptidoglycan/xylan/chitin deacetylase (PgdA/CDA1 family)
VVALTFDDGPDPTWTPPLLEALDDAGVSATFFVVAEQIEAPGGSEVLLETRRRGHSIQMHCGSHQRHDSLELEQLAADAQRIEDVLAAHGVPEPRLWRPPYGSLHAQHSCRVAAQRRRQLIRWTYDSVDYRGLAATAMLERALAAPLRTDSIVLMHDSRRYSSTPEGGARATVELIAPLAEHVRVSGWRFTTLREPLAVAPGGADACRFLLPCGSRACPTHA